MTSTSFGDGRPAILKESPDVPPSVLTAKVIITGLAATLILSWLNNMMWIEFPLAKRADLSDMSLPAAGTLVLVFLVAANLFFRRVGLKRWVFSQAQIVCVLAISLVSVVVASNAALRQLPVGILVPFHQSRAENEWGRLFTDHLPEWFLPNELRQKVGAYDRNLLKSATAALLTASPLPVVSPRIPSPGPDSPAEMLLPESRFDRQYMTDQTHPRYQALFSAFFKGSGPVTWRIWVRPMLVWGAFSIVFYLTLLCFIYLAQSQWIDNERLAFPMMMAPLELTRGGGNKALFSALFFRVGFLVAFFYGVHLFIGEFVPDFPRLVLFVDLKSYLQNKPWNAILLFLLAFDLGAFALFFIMPKDITLSFWAFHLCSTFSYAFGSMMGWGLGNPQSPVAMARWPFYGEVGFGAFAGVLVLALWSGRRHIAAIFRTGFTRHAEDFPAQERMPVRLALWGLVVGMVALVSFGALAGMKPNLSLLFFGLVFVYILSIARVRAESAMPAVAGPDIWSGSPDAIFRAAVGTVHSDATTTAVMGTMSWTSANASASPVPHIMNAFKLAQATGAKRRRMLAIIVAALVVGIVVNGFFIINSNYRSPRGAGGTTAAGLAARAAREAVNDAKRVRPVDTPGLIATGSAVLFSVFLGIMRARFVWWPFHPVGFALGHSFWCSRYWFTAMLAWFAKALVLRYGGASLHRKMFHLCVGVLAGGWTWGAILLVYRIFEVKGPTWGGALFRILF